MNIDLIKNQKRLTRRIKLSPIKEKFPDHFSQSNEKPSEIKEIVKDVQNIFNINNQNQQIQPKYNNKPQSDLIPLPNHQIILNMKFIKTQNLITPYQFLNKGPNAVHTILFPHFTWKSITFFLTFIMIVLFTVLLILCYSQQQNDYTWSCTLFRLQNKFYPRLRYNYQFWRIFVSCLFHSNITHFLLNILGIQIYGYFIQWYYGKIKYIISLILAAFFSHILSCLTHVVTVSTTSSAILYCFLGMKIFFFIKYKQFKLLEGKRTPLYSLLGLVFGINLIVLFIGSNVDYTSHIAGFIVGIFSGIIFFQSTTTTRLTKLIKGIFVLMIIVGGLTLISLCFTSNHQFYLELNTAIDAVC